MKKMNKRFVAGTAFALGAAVSLTGCCLPQPLLYGPAPSVKIVDPGKNTEEDVTSSNNIETATASDVFSDETEVQEAVYGPPEWFEPESEVQEDVYGPPEWFEPELEVQEDVYGPPEWFEPDTSEGK